MLRALQVALLASGHSAAAATLDPPLPGRVGRENTVRVSGVAPGAKVVLAFSHDPGLTPMPRCPGLNVDLAHPDAAGPIVADAGGEAAFTFFAPVEIAGSRRWLQAVDLAACAASQLVAWEVPMLIVGGLDRADGRLLAEPSSYLRSVAMAGDVNGDGRPDLALGAPTGAGSPPGAAYLLLGPPSDWTSRWLHDVAEAEIVEESSGDSLGEPVAGAGDVNGDGFADLVAGAPGVDTSGDDAGAAYLFLGPLTGELTAADADAVYLGEATDDRAGPVAGAGDLDGDGFDDLLVGAPWNDLGEDGSGAAYVIYGPRLGEVDLAFADARLVGPGNSNRLGTSVAAAGDANGDGIADVVVGAPGYWDPVTTRWVGAAFVVTGPLSGDVDVEQHGFLLGQFEDDSDATGHSVAGAGDVDGDGLDDVIVGSPETGRHATGAAQLVLGPPNGRRTDPDARFEGEEEWHYTGESVAGPGDVNGDGFADLLIGASDQEGYQDDRPGDAYLFFGPVGGTVKLSAADLQLSGENPADRAGMSVAGGDLDGDGLADLLVTAPGYDVSSRGALYLIFGSSL